MQTSDQVQKLVIRLPDDLKSFIVEQAKRNASSQNSEIIRAIRDRMDLLHETGRYIEVDGGEARE